MNPTEKTLEALQVIYMRVAELDQSSLESEMLDRFGIGCHFLNPVLDKLLTDEVLLIKNGQIRCTWKLWYDSGAMAERSSNNPISGTALDCGRPPGLG